MPDNWLFLDFVNSRLPSKNTPPPFFTKMGTNGCQRGIRFGRESWGGGRYYSIGSGNDLAPSESRGLYLSQCWPRPMSLYGVTRTQWLSPFHLNFLLHSGPVCFHNARAASLCQSCWTGFSMLWPCLVPMLRPDQKSDGRYQIHRRV